MSIPYPKLNFFLLVAVAVPSIHHFGWEGIGIVAAVWLLMPYKYTSPG